jgi:hypothetical protein
MLASSMNFIRSAGYSQWRKTACEACTPESAGQKQPAARARVLILRLRAMTQKAP